MSLKLFVFMFVVTATWRCLLIFLYLHSCVMPTVKEKHVNTRARYISKLSKQNQHVNDNPFITKYRFSIHSSHKTKKMKRTFKNTHWTGSKI
jgi:hypothetical protein